MEELSLEKIKKVQLDILIYVDKICRDNNIEYSLAYGTLIGAIRHKGFIPWDDDIDIILKRSEYNKLLDILYSEDNVKYKVFSPKDEGYFYPYAKVSDSNTIIREKNWPDYKDLGVNIDIFPIDYVPDGEEKAYYDRMQHYVRCLHNCLTDIAYTHQSKIRSLVKRICRFRKVKKCRSKGESYWKEKIEQMTHIKESKNIACIVDGDYCLWKKELLENYIDIEFENTLFKSSKDYDEMLRKYYGDYMQLLPIEERVSNHDFVAYWK